MSWFSRKKKDDDGTEPKTPKALEEARAARDELTRESPRGFFARLSEGIGKTRTSLVGRMMGLFQSAPTMNDEVFEELEALLISADCGVESSFQIVENLRKTFEANPALTPTEALEIIKKDLGSRIAKNFRPMNLDQTPMAVLLVVGVNGVGKTTTIAKLANIFKAYGKKILLVAADTFRAGAIEQLIKWSERIGVDIQTAPAGSDPSAVAFDGLERAKREGYDLVIIDTAGRLHTQVNLMEEMRKIRRVVKKVLPEAPHETFLVLDATTGQNGLNQAKVFHEAIELSGLVLTKLDGTAKGGIVISIVETLQLPIRFIGVGEKMDDLDAFRPQDFIHALFGDKA